VQSVALQVESVDGRHHADPVELDRWPEERPMAKVRCGSLDHDVSFAGSSNSLRDVRAQCAHLVAWSAAVR